METRFVAAISSAFALHVAVLGVGVWCVAAGTPADPLEATLAEIDVALLMSDAEVAPRAASSEVAPPHSSPRASTKAVATTMGSRTALRSAVTARAETDAVAVEATGMVPSPPGTPGADAGPASDTVPPAAGRSIDLGLDGAIVARALRDTPPRRSAGRPAVVFDDWSEGIVHSIAQRAAPTEGSALLTVEWDASGRLASIRSSAESSHVSTWRKLAESLKRQLARRPQATSGGLRVVYLVKSEIVKPGSRSKLPQSRHVSGEQLRDEHLPPAVSLNVGVKADASPTGQRVVSVTLASSQVL